MQHDATAIAIPTMTIGLDLGDRFSELFALDGSGEIVEQSRVRTTPSGIEQAFAHRRPARVALEVGGQSAWISRQIGSYGHEVVIANARKVRAISDSDNKSDRIDAEMLARLGRVDPHLLRPIKHRSESTQRVRTMLRSRDALVRSRSSLISHVRSSAKIFGHRVRPCSADAFYRRACEQLPDELRDLLRPVLELIARLTHDIRSYDKTLAELSERDYPETRRLRQVAGVGPLTALAYVVTLEDPARFTRARQVGPYLGLRPKHQKSGDRDPQLGITKAGDVHLRRLLVTSAQYILGPFGPDTDLRRWGLAIAERGGGNAKKRAVIAVARKLSVLLYRLWVSGETYEPLRRANAEACT